MRAALGVESLMVLKARPGRDRFLRYRMLDFPPQPEKRGEYMRIGLGRRRSALPFVIAAEQTHAPKIVRRLLATAPPGGDVTSWRY